jgi:hypothetical protein
METIKVTQTRLNEMRKFLYNNETLPPIVELIVQPVPTRISTKQTTLPFLSGIDTNQISFRRTFSGWRANKKIELILNAPCPLLPHMMQEDIRSGYKTIQQIQNAVAITRKDVLVAAFNRLNRN